VYVYNIFSCRDLCKNFFISITYSLNKLSSVFKFCRSWWVWCTVKSAVMADNIVCNNQILTIFRFYNYFPCLYYNTLHWTLEQYRFPNDNWLRTPISAQQRNSLYELVFDRELQTRDLGPKWLKRIYYFKSYIWISSISEF
jgi:hypothetical protein